MASRCARLATSGTTPPNRACSSTLDATESASSSRPRTSPAPVSSHEVSIPSTSGAVMPTGRRLSSLPQPPQTFVLVATTTTKGRGLGGGEGAGGGGTLSSWASGGVGVGGFGRPVFAAEAGPTAWRCGHQAHHECVRAGRLVVPVADPDIGEPAPPVQALGPVVVDP